MPPEPRERPKGQAASSEKPDLPSSEKRETGYKDEELASRIIKQETEGKTYATREWVLHRFIAFAGALLIIGLYFVRDIFSNIFNLLLQLSGSNGFH